MKKFIQKETGFITQVEMKQTKSKVVYWCMFGCLFLVSLITIIPVLWILFSGFKDLEEFFRVPPTIIPQSFHPEKLKEVWNKFNYVLYYKNTLIVAIGSVLFTLVFNGLAGYVISRLKPRGSRAVFTIIMLLMMIPGSVGMVPLYMTICDFPYLHFSMLGTFWPLLIMTMGNCFNILLFKSSFDAIPISYIEAAKIDGANNLYIFFKVIVPLSIPVIVTVTIFTFNAAWGDFLFPYLVLNDNKLYTISVFLFQNKTGQYTEDIYMVMLTLAIVPPTIIYAFLQKHIIGGLTIGGIKG